MPGSASDWEGYSYDQVLHRVTPDSIQCSSESFRQANRCLQSGTPQNEIESPDVNTIVAYARRAVEVLDLIDGQRSGVRPMLSPALGPEDDRPSLRMGQLMRRLDGTGDTRLRAIVRRIRLIYGAAGRELVEGVLERATSEFRLDQLEGLRPDPTSVTTVDEAIALLRRLDAAAAHEFDLPINLGQVVSQLAPQGKVRAVPADIAATGLQIVTALRAFLEKADPLYELFLGNRFFRPREHTSMRALLRNGCAVSYPVVGRLTPHELPANLEFDTKSSELLGSAPCLNIFKAPFLAPADALPLRRTFAFHGFQAAQPDPIRLLIALEQAEMQLDDHAVGLFPAGVRVLLATAAHFNVTRYKTQPAFVVVENGRHRLGPLTREDTALLREGQVQVYSPISVRLS